MAKHTHIDNDDYVLDMSIDGDQVRLSMTLKKKAPAPLRVDRRPGQGQKVVMPANEHHRRNGVYEDEATVIRQGDDVFEVSSRTEPGSWHVVRLADGGNAACTCAAYTLGRHLCRHIRAVRMVEGYPMDAPLQMDAGSEATDDILWDVST